MSTEPKRPFRMRVDREWLERMAKAEAECGDITVGGRDVSPAPLDALARVRALVEPWKKQVEAWEQAAARHDLDAVSLNRMEARQLERARCLYELSAALEPPKGTSASREDQP